MGWGWIKTHEDPEVREFLTKNSEADPWDAILKIPSDKPWSREYVQAQLEGRNPFLRKFPSLDVPGIIIPPKKAIEQASSEISASWKAEIFRGEKLLDLSTGLGGDLAFLSSSFSEAIGIEKEKALAEVSNHNIKVWGSNGQVINDDSINYVQKIKDDSLDLILVDPDRRIQGFRVFRFEDSEPMIAGHIPELLKKAKAVLVKSSPMLDLDYGIRELGVPCSIRIISIGWECKEILFLFKKGSKKGPTSLHLDWYSGGEWKSFELDLKELKSTNSEYGELDEFIYDPNPSILKSRAFAWAIGRFKINKIAPNTHFFSSSKLTPDFPGRILKLKKGGFFKRDYWDPEIRYEVLLRNFPIDRNLIMKENKIREGDSAILIFYLDSRGKKKWVQCEPI